LWLKLLTIKKNRTATPIYIICFKKSALSYKCRPGFLESVTKAKVQKLIISPVH